MDTFWDPELIFSSCPYHTVGKKEIIKLVIEY